MQSKKLIRGLYTRLIHLRAGNRIKFKLTPKPESEQRHFCWCCLLGQIKDWPPNVWNIYETRAHTHTHYTKHTLTHTHTHPQRRKEIYTQTKQNRLPFNRWELLKFNELQKCHTRDHAFDNASPKKDQAWYDAPKRSRMKKGKGRCKKQRRLRLLFRT